MKYRTLQPFDYAGIPQRRKRVFIVAFRDIDDCDAFSFPKEMEEKQAELNAMHQELNGDKVMDAVKDSYFGGK